MFLVYTICIQVNLNGPHVPDSETRGDDPAAETEAGGPLEMGGPGLDEEKLARFRDSCYFRVEVSILCGRDLIAMDRGGTR